MVPPQPQTTQRESVAEPGTLRLNIRCLIRYIIQNLHTMYRAHGCIPLLGQHRTGASGGNIKYIASPTLSQCTLAGPGPGYTGMPLECNWLTQCTLGYKWATQRILAGYTGTPLEKLSWNCPTREYHWINFDNFSLHWNTTGKTYLKLPHTGMPLEKI